MATDKIRRDLPKIAEAYDRVIIDGPPRVNSLGRAAIIASDFVLMPVLPSALDLRATVQTVELLDEVAGTMKDENSFHAAFVLNQKRPNTVVARDAAGALSQFSYPTIAQAITQRVAFAETIAQGTTVVENDPAGTACQEMRNLIREIESIAGANAWTRISHMEIVLRSAHHSHKRSALAAQA
ncbi:AAA family ATPase (plasmid) [Roseibium aggregatum]|uniref:AAA family ATPase n=1 Tax=Roseibium aggregatum TaxID=187304 RepID=UPI001E2BE860|nr:AAA family ATPase [Roseibium aggregatum]UES60103.1 AAA family ATPase [Roseibium aggregatum]